MKNGTPQQRIAAFWKDYERFGRAWSLESTLVLHFGRNPELLLPQAHDYRSANFSHDRLPQEDDHNCGYFKLFVDAAERVIEAHIRTPDGAFVDSLCGYPGGRRADTRTLNLGWSQPFQRTEGSGELKDQLIAELRAATLREDVLPLPKATERSLQLHA